MRCVYVAGAYSAGNVMDVLANMRRGMNLSLRVLQAGYAPFVPWFDYHFSLLSGDIKLEDYYQYSISWLEKSDAVLVVAKGAKQSRGTQKEIARAKEIGIPVFWSISELLGQLPAEGENDEE